MQVLGMERRTNNFGNAGAVNNLLSTAALNLEARTKHLPASQRAAHGIPLVSWPSKPLESYSDLCCWTWVLLSLTSSF